MILAFQSWGQPPTDPRRRIVLLHGLGGTGSLWRPIAAHLETEFQVIAPDQRGHGKSKAAAETRFGPLDYGKDLLETLDKNTLVPAFFAGHSMGARSACAAAFLQPEVCLGLVLIDIGFSGLAGGGLGKTLRSFLEILPPSFPSRADARIFMNQNCPDPSIALYLLAVAEITSNGELRFPFDRDALLSTLDQAQGTELRPWIQKILEHGVPVLALRGERSTVWSRDEFEEEKEFFRNFPSLRFLEVPEAGHGLPFEKREIFLQALKDFVHDA